MGSNAKSAYVFPQLQKRFVAADSEKKRDNSNLLESAVNNNHCLPNQPMLPPAILSKILSSLTNISSANTLLLLETFQDLDEDFFKSPIMK